MNRFGVSLLYNVMRNRRCDLHGDKFIVKWNSGSRVRYACRECVRITTYNHRKKCKQKLVELFGGKCEVCGYNKSTRSLQFHHLIPLTKGFNLGSWKSTLSYEIMLEEAKKCILVCANCHGEIEEGGTTAISPSLLDRSVINDKLEEIRVRFRAKKAKKIYNKVCKQCNAAFVTAIRNQTHCCADCGGLSKRKADRPSKEALGEMLWSMPTTKIADLFGVSDKAIEKWAKKYKLDKPSRGYWTKKT